MRNRFLATAALLTMATTASGCMTMDDGGMSASAGNTVMVGGAAMYPSRNIVENAVNSQIHTTLVAAVQAAGLVDTLSGPGPFTVFAPTNSAFAALPPGTVETLLQPANRQQLASVLTYHVVPGRLSAADLMSRIRAGGGSARLTTVNGGTLTARMQGSSVVLVDASSNTATVVQADVFQSNGVIHVTDRVSIPG